MHFLVAYVEHPSRSELRGLQRLFGAEFQGSILPIVSSPFASADEANARLIEVGPAAIDGQAEAILVQPSEQHISSMPLESALRLLKDDTAWNAFLEDFGAIEAETELRAVELARCWVVLARVARTQIPPGEAFLVDKHSGRVFPRRYVDAVSSMSELGLLKER